MLSVEAKEKLIIEQKPFVLKSVKRFEIFGGTPGRPNDRY